MLYNNQSCGPWPYVKTRVYRVLVKEEKYLTMSRHS